MGRQVRAEIQRGACFRSVEDKPLCFSAKTAAAVLLGRAMEGKLQEALAVAGGGCFLVRGKWEETQQVIKPLVPEGGVLQMSAQVLAQEWA
eukprot:15244661-Alexandrium_andersonii.AAC.1